MEEHGKMALMVQGGRGKKRAWIHYIENLGFNHALLYFTHSDAKLLMVMVPEEVVSRLTWMGM